MASWWRRVSSAEPLTIVELGSGHKACRNPLAEQTHIYSEWSESFKISLCYLQRSCSYVHILAQAQCLNKKGATVFNTHRAYIYLASGAPGLGSRVLCREGDITKDY